MGERRRRWGSKKEKFSGFRKSMVEDKSSVDIFIIEEEVILGYPNISKKSGKERGPRNIKFQSFFMVTVVF